MAPKLTLPSTCAILAVVASGAFAQELIPGPSLLANSGFETAIATNQACGPAVPYSSGGWLAFAQTNGALPTLVSTPVHSGAQSGRVATPPNGGCSSGYFVQDVATFVTTESFEFSYWVYPVAGSQQAWILFGWDRGNGSVLGLAGVDMSPTDTRFEAWGSRRTVAPLVYGQWHFVLLRANATDRTLELFLDGVLAGEAALGEAAYGVGVTVLLGQASGTNSAPDDFYYDDVFLARLERRLRLSTPVGRRWTRSNRN